MSGPGGWRFADVTDQVRRLAAVGGTIVVHGEAGCGRTSCCDHLETFAVDDRRREDGPGEEWLVAAARPTPGTPATTVFHHLARALLATCSDPGGPTGHGPADDSTEPESLVELARQVAGTRPVLLLIDDADSIDDPSGAALARLTAAVRGHPFVLVLTARAPARLSLGTASVHWIELGPLGRHELSRLIDDLTGETANDVALRRIGALADGNLRTAVELIGHLSRHQVRSGELIDASDLSELPSARLVRAAMHRLPDRSRTAMVVAAMGTREPMGTLVTALADLGLSIDDLAPVEAEGWIRTSTAGVTFLHPLHRLGAQAVASFTERRRIIAALTRAVARHDGLRGAWYEAMVAVAPDEELTERLTDLATRALEGGDPRFASLVWREAARLDPDGPETALVRAADAALVGGRLDDATELALQVVSGRPTPAERAEARRVQGLAMIWQGRPEQALNLLTAEAELLGPTGGLEATALLLQGTLGALHAGHLHTAAGLAARAVETGRGLGPLATATAAVEGSTRAALGDPDGVAAIRAASNLHVEAAPFVTTTPPILHLTSWVGRMLSEVGDTDAASAMIDWTLEQAIQHGYTMYQLMPLAHRASALVRRGQLDAAEVDADRLEQLVDDHGHAEHRMTWSSIRGRIDVLRGRGSGWDALRHVVQHSSGPAQLEALVAMGSAALAIGDIEEAVHLLERARTICVRAGFAHPAFAPYEADLVEALVHNGDAEQAAMLAKAHAELAERWPVALVKGLAARSLALTATEPDDEREHVGRSLELLTQAGAPIEYGRTALCHGERLRRRRARREARSFLWEALDAFERAGAMVWATRARDELRATGAPPPSGGTTARPAADLGGLSERETAIALAVADGRTNREVAAALHLSPKTIENQLSRIYAKLGVRSRTELARAVRATD